MPDENETILFGGSSQPTDDTEPPAYSGFCQSRYVVAAELVKEDKSREMMFLGHNLVNEYIWTSDCFSNIVCYEEELILMKPLIKQGRLSAEGQPYILTNVRPYMLWAGLKECYDYYLTQVKEAEDKELFERYNKMLEEGFTDDERRRLSSVATIS